MKEKKQEPKKMGRPERYTEKYINELIEDLNKWSDREDALIFRQWAAYKNIPYTTLAELSDRFDNFSESLKIAKMKIGCRRELKGLRGELDSGIISKTMGIYDPEYCAHIMETKVSNAKALGTAVAESITIELYDSKKKKELENDKTSL